MERMDKDKLIVIGGDHHNTLSVVRCFGRNRPEVVLIVHGEDKKKCKCAKSRYVTSFQYVDENEKEILDLLLSYSDSESNKCFIFPCSDLAAYIIDKNRDVLAEHFAFPLFYKESFSIEQLMDKREQISLADKLRIPTAQSWFIQLGEKELVLPMNMAIPCIIKPQCSALGAKADIQKAFSISECISILDGYRQKGYEEVMVQELIKYDMQFLTCGCVLPNNDKTVGTTFRKERESKNGSTGLGIVYKDPLVEAEKEKIVDFLKGNKYWGCYDIEFFKEGKRVFLNEINFRHSGAGCLMIDNHIPIPVLWYLDYYGRIDCMNCELESGTSFQSEIDDLYNVYTKKISMVRWAHDFVKTKSHTIFNSKDLRGSFAFYSSFVYTVFLKLIK